MTTLLETYLTELNNNYESLTLKPFNKNDINLVYKAISKKPYHPIFSENIEVRYIESDEISVDAYKVFNRNKLVCIVSFNFFHSHSFSMMDGFDFYISNPEIRFVSFDTPLMTAWGIMKAVLDYTGNEGNEQFEIPIYSKDTFNMKVMSLLKANKVKTGKVKDKGIEYVDYLYTIEKPFWWVK